MGQLRNLTTFKWTQPNTIKSLRISIFIISGQPSLSPTTGITVMEVTVGTPATGAGMGGGRGGLRFQKDKTTTISRQHSNMTNIILVRAADALPEPVAGPMPQPEADAHYGYYGYGQHYVGGGYDADDVDHGYYGYGSLPRVFV